MPDRVLTMVFLWVLTFTSPTQNSGATGSCAIGCRDTTLSTPTLDCAVFEVWRHRQSPTWVAHAAAINANIRAGRSDTLAFYWPTVRSEAAWVFLVSRTTSAAEEGKTCSIALADTMATGWFYAVVTRDTAGNRSCVSNEVWR